MYECCANFYCLPMIPSILQLLSNLLYYSVLLLLMWWGWYYWRNRKLMAVARKLPTVLPTVPLLGHLHHSFRFSGGFIEFISVFVFKIITKQAAERGINQFCLWIGPFPLIFAQSPQDIQTVLTNPNCRDKGSEYDLIDFAMKDGLLTAKGDIWRPTRRHIGPLFHPRNVEHLMHSFNSQGRRLCNVLTKCGEGETVDVFPEILPLTVDPVFDLILGQHAAFCEDNPKVVTNAVTFVKKSLKLWMVRVLHYYSIIDHNIIFNKLYKKQLDKIAKLISEFTSPAIEIFQNTPVDSITRENYNENSSPSSSQNYEFQISLMEIYLSMKENGKYCDFNEEGLKFNICTILIGGTDTTSVILSSCLLMLAMHPGVQEKVFEQITSITGSSYEDVSLSEIKRMNYLDQVIKETLRLFPVIPIISRTPKEDLNLSFGKVPGGADVYICLFGLHRNPHIYKNPEVFDPDRFAAEFHSSRHKFAYLPFSAGPRNCIGKEYSMMSMKTTIVHVLRNFKLSTKMEMKDIKMTYALDISIKNGYPIQAERR